MRIILGRKKYLQQKLDQEKNKRLRHICSCKEDPRKGESGGVPRGSDPLLTWIIWALRLHAREGAGGEGFSEPRELVRAFQKH